MVGERERGGGGSMGKRTLFGRELARGDGLMDEPAGWEAYKRKGQLRKIAQRMRTWLWKERERELNK